MELVGKENSVLRTLCEPVDFSNPPFPLPEFTQRMLSRMRDFKGIGLAAPQIGVSYQIFVMQVNLPRVVINPVITPVDNEMVRDYEGCLSFPGLRMKIKRHKAITVQYQTEIGDTVVETLTGLESRCFQHEYDHIQGVCFDARVGKVDLRIALAKMPSII